MPDTSDALPPPLPASESVETAVCITCGYALAGLDPNSVCPECGESIERSLRGNRLLYAPADYVRTLHRALVLVLTGIALPLVLLIVVSLGSLLVFMVFPGSVPPWLNADLVWALSSLVLLVSMVTLLVGYWMLSLPHPGFAGRDDAARARRWLRIGVAALAAVVVAMAAMMSPMARGLPQPDWALLLVGLILVSSVTTVFIASVQLVRRLGPLADDRVIASRGLLYLCLCPLLVVIGSALCAFLTLIGVVLYWNLLDRLRRDLKRLRAQQAVMLAAELGEATPSGART